jgi:hypothetical protein
VIFVGYEEHRIGWCVCDPKRKYSFSADVIFNENLSARLGIPHSLAPPLDFSLSLSLPSVPARPRICTSLGQAYDDAIAIKRSRNELCRRNRLMKLDDVAHDGVSAVDVVGGIPIVGEDGGVDVHGGDISEAADALYGGDSVGCLMTDILAFAGGANDLSPSIDAIHSFISLIDSSSFSDPISTTSLFDFEMDLLTSFSFVQFALKVFSVPFSQPFNFTKPPSSYMEAIARPNAQICHSAMDRERQSLADMGAFEEVELPIGE